jgi:hypothetical protein
MLNHHKQAPQLNGIFLANELHEIMLHGEYVGPLDLELGDILEISSEASKIDEMQIDKLYLYL